MSASEMPKRKQKQSMAVAPIASLTTFYESVLLNELCACVLAQDAPGAPPPQPLGRRVQFICRLDSLDNLVDAAVATDPGDPAYRMPLATRLVSPLDGPRSGLWRIFGVFYVVPSPLVEVFIAAYAGDIDYRLYVKTIEVRRKLLRATGLS
jgi:hypothetical protein